MAATDRNGLAPYLQAAPLALVFLLFLVIPLAFIVMVSVWTYDNYQIQPAFTLQNYADVFDRCISRLPTLCTTFRTYLSTLGFALRVWVLTLGIGFTIAYFLAFEVRSKAMQSVLFLICTIPFWTSNVIRMISWIPLLGREGLVNRTLMSLGAIDQPIDWLLYSSFSVTLTFVHLFTFFMVVPIYNSMLRIDRSLIEAARDAGASGWQILWNVIVPLSKTGIAIGSIFVLTIVMGDFVTVGLMGGQQIASVGKTIQTEISYLQFPIAAANAVVLLATVLLIVFALLRVVDIRKEL
ncbi:ABC transporter permease [uncultured Aureimonas sp.]|uniref:ABC transporter permease n=1 Tax=uncultured Aureimonas sp. TaxID=1604662 RepID=UPI0025E491FF|nr:ABC transporter permease [uncultured Aureimonas sp.]